MKEKEERKKYEELVRARLPDKRKKAECALLLWRLFRYGAVDFEHAISTTEISNGIKNAHGHLNDLRKAGLVAVSSKKPIRAFLDGGNPTKRFLHGREISEARARNISELRRQMGDSARVKQTALASISAKDEKELTDKVTQSDDIFNKVVAALVAAGLVDRNYLFGEMGWRTGADTWYLQ